VLAQRQAIDAANARIQRPRHQFKYAECVASNATTDRAADQRAQRCQNDDVREFDINKIIELVKAPATLMAQIPIRMR